MEIIDELRWVTTQTKLRGTCICQLLKRPDFTTQSLPEELQKLAPAELWELVETDLKYEGYMARQASQNRAIARQDSQRIPDGLDYGRIAGLRSETRQKLATIRPSSLGQAARISGITPTDIAIISIWLTKTNLHQGKPHI
jgi:tRNA uridine 5-carboxymethylaminomethyl modification enzyme